MGQRHEKLQSKNKKEPHHEIRHPCPSHNIYRVISPG